MKKILFTTLVILAVCSLGTSAEAAFTNIGFETGDFTGWTFAGASGTRDVLTGSAGTGYGSKYVQINGGSANQWVSIVQTAHLDAGDILDGAVKFQYNDWGSSYPDDMIAQIQDYTSGTTVSTDLFYKKTQSTSGWEYWQFVAPASGSYTLTYASANRTDNLYSSYAFFDTKQTASNAIPEPATMVLLGTGLMGLAGIKRKYNIGTSA